MGFMNHLLTYGPVYSLLAATIVAIATVVYVCLTYRLIRDSQHSRIQPNIVFDIGRRYGLVLISVKNIGVGVANNITVTIDPAIPTTNPKAPEMSTFSLASLAPGQEYREYFTVDGPAIKADRIITVGYLDVYGTKTQHQRTFDAKLLDNEVGAFSPDPYRRLDDRLKGIESILKSSKSDDYLKEISRSLKTISDKIKR